VLPLERKRVVDLQFSNAYPGRYQGFIVMRTSNGFQLKMFVEVTVVKGVEHYLGANKQRRNSFYAVSIGL
jgi:hypothetical protein